MKFVKVQDRIINVNSIVELVVSENHDDHFNRIGWKYTLVVSGGSCFEFIVLKKEEYDDLKEILLNSNYDNSEA